MFDTVVLNSGLLLGGIPQHAVLFDRVVVVGLDHVMASPRGFLSLSGMSESTFSAYVEAGILIGPEGRPARSAEREDPDDDQSELRAINGFLHKNSCPCPRCYPAWEEEPAISVELPAEEEVVLREFLDVVRKVNVYKYDTPEFIRDFSDYFFDLEKDFCDLSSKYFSMFLSRQHGFRALPVFLKREATDANAIELVMNDIEMPSVETPVEAVLEFRADPIAREHLLALRSWARRAHRVAGTSQDLLEEYDFLRMRYNNYIEGERVRFKKSSLRTIFLQTLQALHQLASLNPKGLETAYNIYKARVPSVALSCGDPGYELAILQDIERNFGRSHD